ncbi:MAG: nuclear transport factor 2 family protein [Candidatus Krumholzibacteriota bacterium]|nr:nuclear transport factor 2 family protein [Candidatus Krumholzibacteriota bacterium]
MKKSFTLIIALLLITAFYAGAIHADDQADVRKVIESSYFNGAFNDQDTATMRNGFHPDFAIFSADGNKINRYPIDTWIAGIEKRKSDPSFDRTKVRMDCKIVALDVTGGCASAKIEASRDGKLIYTDYLSLLKFEDGWKIVAKVYHGHK